ncbi:MAG: type II toxin-antitoxin system VapC family toxin [Flavisolibacter sp.]
MNGNKYLLDTNIILYILSGNKTLANYLHRKNLYVSIISEIELLGFKGLTSVEEKNIKAFLSEFRVIYIDDTIKNETVSLRKQYGIKIPDCIIAATAISLNIPLITADKQFKKINNLLLEVYEESL